MLDKLIELEVTVTMMVAVMVLMLRVYTHTNRPDYLKTDYDGGDCDDRLLIHCPPIRPFFTYL